MSPAVLEELRIIKSELKKAGVDVPLAEMEKWSVRDRAYAEQWALGAEGVEIPDVVKPFLKVRGRLIPSKPDQKVSN